MTIQNQRCPRCRIARTVSMYRLNHCFNCKYQWTGPERALAFSFTQKELERLLTYRGAVRAGIYSDWPVFA